LIAKEAETGNLGIVTASRLVAGGAFIPFLHGGIGAVAAQNLPEPRIASVILEDLSAGVDPQAALERALRFFGWADQRQVGLLVALPQEGQLPALAFTGQNCPVYSGHRVHNDLVVLGAGLSSEKVLEAAENAYLQSGSPHLAERLLEALIAGELLDCPESAIPGLREEGLKDLRSVTDTGSMEDFEKEMEEAAKKPVNEAIENKSQPKNSASIKVVSGQTFQTPLLDLRVDDHERAASELHRVWILYQRMSAS
jgi:uncharacterized Ntn-hydrolase superfamily protein